MWNADVTKVPGGKEGSKGVSLFRMQKRERSWVTG